LLPGLQLPNIIADPSAVMFINAVMLYGIAVLVCYDVRKMDVYQDRVLALAVLCGSVIAGSIAAYEGDMDLFKRYLPAVITLSLLMSPAVPQILTRLFLIQRT
jgi:hypothetical protein